MKTIKALYSQIAKLPLFLVILIASISLVGWIIGKIIIASVSMNFIPMAPSTGFFFLILGISLFITKNYSGTQLSRRIILSLLAFTLLFCVIILIEFLFNLNFDIENIFISNPANFDKVTIGRMSPITAFLFGTSCIGIWGKVNRNSRIIGYFGGSSATLTTFFASVLVIGYLYRAPLLYGQDIIPVALLTAICFLLLGISLIQLYDLKYWTFNLFQNNQIQLKLLSTFLPLAIFIIVLQGFIETNFSANQKNPTLTTALIILIIVGITIFVVTKASSYLGQKLTEAENALKENTNFLDKVIESSAVSTWISDENGTAIRTNPACLKFFGAEKEEVIGKYNILKDSVIEAKGFMPVIRDVFEKGNYANIIIDYDFASVDHVTVKKGTHKIVNSLLTPVTDVNGKVTNVIVQAIDLTEIKSIQETAIQERNKAQQYLDIAGVMLVSLDDKGIVQLINPKGCEILGYAKEDILGKNWFDIFIPEDEKEKVSDVERKAYSGKLDEVQYFENKIKTKSGEERLIAWRNALLKDDNNNIVGTLSSGEDITERKIAEQQLIDAKELAEESEKRFRTIAEQSTEGITVADMAGRYVYVNKTFCDMSGYSREELLQMTVFDMAAKRNESEFHNKENVSGKKRVFVLQKKDGTLYHTEITGTNIEINKQKLVLGSIRDISDIIRYQNDLIKAKQRAEESDRIKTAFLQNMSHEIRTPMNSIMGFASLLPDEQDKSLIDNYSNIIYKNSEQLVHIIDAIVLYTRLQNKQMPLNSKQFDFTKLLEEVRLSFNIPKYQQEVKLKIEDQPIDPVFIQSDYEKIWQIYTNLISNAFKYTLNGEISFGLKRGENEWICFVTDTGIGIPANEIDKIFDRFYRASNVDKGKIGGTGLGLSIVMELVEIIGGKIWVESEEERGSKFYFTIPQN